MRVLIGYDGSPHSRLAIRQAAHLFEGGTATVLTVWDDLPLVSARARAQLSSSLDFEGIDRTCRERAWQCAAEGTSHARAAGLAASALAVARMTTVAEALLRQAGEVGADVVVLGSRGLGAVRSVVVGSTARATLRLSDRPVLVVPGQGFPCDDVEPFDAAALTAGVA